MCRPRFPGLVHVSRDHVYSTLEDWFNLRDDYGPTGFRNVGVRAHAVPGHEFGLRLSNEDKAALIAFLKTL